MNKVIPSKPQYKLDKKSLEKDLEFAREKDLSQAFIRRRIVFFMDGYRHAAEAVKKRWGLDIVFFEAGHDLVKNIYFIDKFNEEAAQIWLKKLDEDPHFTDKIIGELKNIIETAKQLAASVPDCTLTSKEIRSCIENHLAWWVKYFEVAFLWFSVENIREHINGEIRKVWKGNKEELEHFLDSVYRPVEHPLSSIEQRDLLKLKDLKGSEREEALEKHWQKYKHLALHDSIGDSFFTIEDFSDRLKIIDQPKELKKVEKSLERADKEIEFATTFLEEADLPEDLKKKVDFVRWFMYIRTDSIDYMTKVNAAYKRVFQSIGDMFDLPMSACLMMTYEEILSSLKKEELIISRKNILDREKNGYAYFIGPSGSYLVTGDAVDEFIALAFPKMDDNQPKEVIGQIAFPGIARGKARVVLDSSKAGEVKEGEILITTMTNPQYVPAMKRSAAIVTNEGGVLCHAAIMSREFRTPCIIGTKKATNIFKTGDMVEVDADNGVVKIIKK